MGFYEVDESLLGFIRCSWGFRGLRVYRSYVLQSQLGFVGFRASFVQSSQPADFSQICGIPRNVECTWPATRGLSVVLSLRVCRIPFSIMVDGGIIISHLPCNSPTAPSPFSDFRPHSHRLAGHVRSSSNSLYPP